MRSPVKNPEVFKTAADRLAWAMQSITNMLTLAIIWNPRGAYAAIKLRYGNEFPNLEQGAEASEVNINNMFDFIYGKAIKSSNPGQFATDFAHAVPDSTVYDSSLTFLKSA